jgi:hypothetical protein
MVRNMDGLKRSARSRSEDSMQRATTAILLMQSEEVELNFAASLRVRKYRRPGSTEQSPSGTRL